MTMNGMHGQRGIETIPTFDVIELESLLREREELPNPGALVDGFAVVDNGATPLFDRIHPRHTKAARQLLEGCRILGDELQARFEGKQQNGRHSPSHVDGLVGRYYQAHTTLPENPDVCSDAVVDRYDLSAEEHELLQGLLREGVGHTANVRVHRDEQYPQTLHSALGNRAPDFSWSRRALWGTTLVFPNGYDARPGTLPTRLHMHSFRTGRAGAEGETTESLPRLRRAEISRIQRAEDSRGLDGRGPKRSWSPWGRTSRR